MEHKNSSQFVSNIACDICEGHLITKEEALKLANDVALKELLYYANLIRTSCCGKEFNFCSIINAKSGMCSENCSYCAQSRFYKTNCNVHPLIPLSSALDAALYADKKGINRFSLVASGRGLTCSSSDLPQIQNIYKTLSKETSLHLCASFGIVDKEVLTLLKESGVKTYHHNLESSRNFFPKICTTHTYDDRIKTLQNCKAVGLDICSGGIFGLGETLEDRLDMAFELRELGVTSVPINILSPIAGTPLEHNKPLSKDTILKSMALLRFILPTAYLRFAGGRVALKPKVKDALTGGINAALTGDFLTTTGDCVDDDFNLIFSLGFTHSKRKTNE